MVNRTKEGNGDVSDDGVNEILQGFVLTPKIDGEMEGSVCAEHSRFNCRIPTCTRNSYMCSCAICNLRAGFCVHVVVQSLPAMKWRLFRVFAPKLEITGDGPGAREGDPALSE